MVLAWRFTDTNEQITSTLDHAALTYVTRARPASAPAADATVSTTRAVFNAVVLRSRTFADARQKGELTVTGNAAKLDELMSYFDDFDPSFNIVEPRRAR
jgi:alkyl sulfatase BDS1-like metallo-beta-lactamase superfamily hydrolase